MTRIVMGLMFLALVFQGRTVRAQAQCSQDPSCESRCRAQAKTCDAAPPAGVVRDVGPEPPRRIKVSTMVEASAWTTMNMDGAGVGLGWLDTQADAEAAAERNAIDKLYGLCNKTSGSLGSRSRVGQSVCKTHTDKGPRSQKTVYNCLVAARADCTTDSPNPDHDTWKTLKAASDEQARRLGQRTREHEQCHQARDVQLRACARQCGCEPAPNSGGPTSGGASGGAGSASTGGSVDGRVVPPPSDSDGGGPTTSTRVILPPNAPRTAAEGIERANAQKAAIDASFDQAMAKIANNPKGGSLKGPGAVMAFLAVFAPPIVIATRGAGFDAVVFNAVLPMLIGGMLVTGGVLAPWAVNTLDATSTHPVSLRSYRATVDSHCQTSTVESCVDARSSLLGYLNGIDPSTVRRLRAFWWGPGDGFAPAAALTTTVGFVSGTMKRDDTEIDHAGYYFRLAGRRGFARASAEMRSTWGNFNDMGTEGMFALGLGLGVQVGSGFLSPYAEAKGHLQKATRGAPSGGADYGLHLGNTFNFHTLSAKRGSFTGALAIDAGVMLPLGGRTVSGFFVALGYAAVKAAPGEGFDLAAANAPRRWDQTEYLSARLTLSSAGFGAGVEAATFRFDHPVIQTLSVGDIRILPHGMALSAAMPGHERRVGNLRYYAAITPAAGSWGANYSAFGAMRFGGGIDSELARIDAGIELPIYWSGTDGAYATFDPVTAFVRAAY